MSLPSKRCSGGKRRPALSAAPAELPAPEARIGSGPRTPEGKAASSRNAITHGLTARTILLAGEDPDEYRRLREEAIAGLRPEGALELELAEQIVSVLWRMRRISVFEAALLEWLEALEREHDRNYALIAPRKKNDEQTLAWANCQGTFELGLLRQTQPPRGKPAAGVIGAFERAAGDAGTPARCGPRRKRPAEPARLPARRPVPSSATFAIVTGSQVKGCAAVPPATILTRPRPAGSPAGRQTSGAGRRKKCGAQALHMGCNHPAPSWKAANRHASLCKGLPGNGQCPHYGPGNFIIALPLPTRLLSSDDSGKLSHYKTSLPRQLSTLLKELREMQPGQEAAGANPVTPSPAGDRSINQSTP